MTSKTVNKPINRIRNASKIEDNCVVRHPKYGICSVLSVSIDKTELVLVDQKGDHKIVPNENVKFIRSAEAEGKRKRISTDREELERMDGKQTLALYDAIYKTPYCRWCPELFDFLNTSDEVIFFSFLLNISGLNARGGDERMRKMKEKFSDTWKRKEEGPWFHCSTERVKTAIKFSWDKQHRIVKRLVKLGLLFSRVRGMGKTRRQFMVNLNELKRRMDVIMEQKMREFQGFDV